MIRYLILFTSCISMSLMMANFSIFNFTVICMKPDDGVTSLNGSTIRKFSSYEESFLFAAVSAGRILGSYPAVKLFDLFGLRISFTAFGVLSGLGSVIVPLLGSHFYVVFASRIIQGITMAAVFLAFGVIPNAFGNETEKSLFVSVLSCSLQLGPCFIMVVSGFFCSSSLGWQSAFYASGGLTIAVFTLFFFSYRERTSKASSVYPEKPALADAFEAQNQVQTQESAQPVPYRSIVTSASFWGIMIVAFGDTIGFNVFLIYGPTYINKVLNFEVAQTGMLSALPYILSIVTKTVCGVLLDKATCVKERYRVLLFVSFSQAAMTACFIALTFITPETAYLAQVMLTLMTVFSGLAFIGILSGNQIISQQYSHIVSSALAVQDSLAGLLVPFLVGLIAPNHGVSEWVTVFYVFIGFLVASNVLFVGLTKVKPAKWTK